MLFPWYNPNYTIKLKKRETKDYILSYATIIVGNNKDIISDDIVVFYEPIDEGVIFI